MTANSFGGFSFSGLYFIDENFVEQMERIMIPRLNAGRDAIPEHLRMQHPSQSIAANNRPNAGTASYYAAYADYYRRINGGKVAVIPVQGPMSRYGNCSWGTEDLKGIMQAADQLEDVKAVVLRADTPGGTVDGTKAFADAVAGMNKPVVLWTNFCASAGVFVGSQASEIWLEPQTVTQIGSIGVLSVYVDQSAALEKQGYKVQIIRADGSHDKAKMNGIEPLDADTLAEQKGLLNACRQEFLGYVRRGRAGKLTSSEWESGKMFGVKDALRIGLADRTGSLDQAINRALQLSKSN